MLRGGGVDGMLNEPQNGQRPACINLKQAGNKNMSERTDRRYATVQHGSETNKSWISNTVHTMLQYEEEGTYNKILPRFKF
jgi:hypothetical protein